MIAQSPRRHERRIAAVRSDNGEEAVSGPADAFWSSVTTDDAASAVVAALGAPNGVYNVADDCPLRRSEHASALAEALGTNTLQPPPGAADLPDDLAVML